MAQNDLLNLLVALRDQLRSEIDGTGNYNYDVSDSQVVLGFKTPDQAPIDPFICIASATEDLENIALDSNAQHSIVIEIYGYVHNQSSEIAMEDVLKLLSDILNAIQADMEIGDRLSDLSVATEVGSDDDLRLGVCVVTLSGRYWT